MFRRSCLLAILLSTVIACNSDDRRRPTWTLSDRALSGLDLGPGADIHAGSSDSPAEGECRAALRLHLPDASPIAFLTPSAARSALQQAQDIQLECRGRCGDGTNCKTHHVVDSPESKWATTGCVCDPQTPLVCGLTVRWEVGARSRRRIDQIACNPPLGTAVCSVRLRQDGRDLQIDCAGQG